MWEAEKVILAIFIFISLALGYIVFKSEKQVQTPDYSERIDSLESELSSIKSKRDSIAGKIDTTVIKIEQNEKSYKETISNIINNTTSDDYIFFINYLKWNRERFDSINNFNSTEGD